MKHARELWSKDDAPTPEVTMEEILTRADTLRRKVRFSNTMELVAGAFVVVIFVAMAALPDFTRLPALSRVGAALIACAAIFVLTYLVLRSKAPEVRRDTSTLGCYREELERRRALLASVVWWYLAPFWPGMTLFFAGIVIAHWGEPPAMRAGALSFLVAALVNVSIALLNRRVARKLAAELASLPPAAD
jgi:MFS family permease